MNVTIKTSFGIEDTLDRCTLLRITRRHVIIDRKLSPSSGVEITMMKDQVTEIIVEDAVT